MAISTAQCQTFILPIRECALNCYLPDGSLSSWIRCVLLSTVLPVLFFSFSSLATRVARLHYLFHAFCDA